MSRLPADWSTKPLGSVATLQRGFDLPIQDRREGPVTIFAANGPVGTHDIHKVEGPGVVTGRSGTLGKVHFVEQDYWPLNTALWVKDFHGNEPAWVCRLLTWMRLEQFTRGAGVPTLNRNLVHVVEVPLPPLAEQKRIAGILDAADALRAKRRELLAQLDTLLQTTFLDMFGDPVTNPMGWDECTVGDVTDCIVPGRDKPKSFTGSTPWITTDDLVDLAVTSVSPKGIGLSPEEIAEVRVRVIPEGSVIVSCVGCNRQPAGQQARLVGV